MSKVLISRLSPYMNSLRPREMNGLVAGVILVWLLQSVVAGAQSKRHGTKSPEFSYYVLVLSYAPTYCMTPGFDDPRECGPGRHINFVVRGLWAEGREGSRGPENCGAPGSVSAAIIRTMLNYMPSETMIQHEWKTHGTCSGLGIEDFFYTLRKARDSLAIPPELNEPSHTVRFNPGELQLKFADANPGFDSKSFEIVCYPGEYLAEVRVCLNKDLSPRSCNSRATRCGNGGVTVPPVR